MSPKAIPSRARKKQRPRRAGPHLPVTPRRIEKFLAALADHGIWLEACRQASPGSAKRFPKSAATSTWKTLKKNDPEFARRCEQALECAAARVEKTLVERGIDGFDETRTDARGQVTTHRRYSDACLLALAKVRIPAFRDRVEVEAKVVHLDLGALARMSRESRDEMRRILEREGEGDDEDGVPASEEATR